jgi:hypothetical protein
MTGGRPVRVPRSNVVSSAASWMAARRRKCRCPHGYAAGATRSPHRRPSSTDVLIVRGVDPGAITVAAAAADSHLNDYFLQTSACANPAIDPADRSFVVASGGGGAPAAFTLHQTDCVTPALLRRLVVRAYYVGKCSVCTGSGDGIPTLRMVELAGLSATSASLVEGIDARGSSLRWTPTAMARSMHCGAARTTPIRARRTTGAG